MNTVLSINASWNPWRLKYCSILSHYCSTFVSHRHTTLRITVLFPYGFPMANYFSNQKNYTEKLRTQVAPTFRTSVNTFLRLNANKTERGRVRGNNCSLTHGWSPWRPSTDRKEKRNRYEKNRQQAQCIIHLQQKPPPAAADTHIHTHPLSLSLSLSLTSQSPHRKTHALLIRRASPFRYENIPLTDYVWVLPTHQAR